MSICSNHPYTTKEYTHMATELSLRSSNKRHQANGATSDHHHIVNISQVDQTWLDTVEEKTKKAPNLLKTYAGKESCCIFRVPQSLVEINEAAYQPHVASIGPYHHGKQHLKMIEEHKWRFLGAVLARTRQHGVGLDQFFEIIAQQEEKIRESYSETIEYTRHELIEMMVLDGCFIIELFCIVGRVVQTDPDDPIFNMSWIFYFLIRDLLRLENQIPFFVLESLFELSILSSRKGNVQSLSELALEFFDYALQRPPEVLNCYTKLSGKHLLDLFRLTLIPPYQEVPRKSSPFLRLIPSANKLRKAGIRFNPRQAHSFLDIKFSDGVLEIPTLTIDDFTSSILLNCVAFEQCYNHCSKHFTSYVTFMVCLVNTPVDAGFLCDRKVLENYFGPDEQVAQFFNNLGKDVPSDIERSYLAEVFEDVNEYYSNNWHVRWAGFKHTYFDTPWSFMSALAAVVLLLLTMVQAYFAVNHNQEQETTTHHDVEISIPEPDPSWLDSVEERINEAAPKLHNNPVGSSSCCIFRVPQRLSNLNEKAYQPHVVSIGPYHHGEPDLQMVQEHKWRYLGNVLARRKQDGVGLNELFKAIAVMEGKDLLRLENQIPYFVLQKLDELLRPSSTKENAPSLAELALGFFDSAPIPELDMRKNIKGLHLLDLFRLSLIPPSLPKSTGREDEPNHVIHSAKKLNLVGIKFNPSRATDTFLDVKFSDGVFKIPTITVDDFICTLFLNCLAFEDCYSSYCSNHITCYVFFMSFLIRTAADMELLCAIVQNYIGTDLEVAEFFQKATKDTVFNIGESYLTGLFQDVHQYHRLSWRVRFKAMKNAVAATPWPLLSVLAASTLLILTVIQAFYAVYANNMEMESTLSSNHNQEQETTTHHAVVSIPEADQNWLASVEKRIIEAPKLLNKSAGSRSCCIFRVPQSLFNRDEKAYQPHVVSIGPYHHGKPDLQMVQEHKWRYLGNVLARRKQDGVGLNELFKAIAVMEGKDLLRLENQIPYFVLQTLYKLLFPSSTKENAPSLTELALGFFNYAAQRPEAELDRCKNLEGGHLLDLFRLSLIPPSLPESTGRPGAPLHVIHSAKKLNLVGIKFNPSRATDTFLDVKFSDGVLEIPTITVDDFICTFFLNCVAFEDCYSYCSKHITCYVIFIGFLIQTPADSELLCNHAILENYIGTDVEVAEFFQKATKDAALDVDMSYLAGLFQDVHKYYRTSWRVQLKAVKNAVTVTPWPLLAVLAASTALILTMIQAFYANGKAWKQNKNPN
ncbi:hypothetical protein Tsubulata_008984 [Turnera subulata]|uniref:Uncharacterized protein n=1 Tax=Turnera subulata TaxID=218843 RepID=A0A9Q0J8F3_9ROSI|nr:hypothetical protein Tsubulata_008984 [Turnera subulata]